MDEAYALIGIGLAFFSLLIIIMGVGTFYGGEWELVAQGLTQFMLLAVAFSFGVYVVVKVMGKR